MQFFSKNVLFFDGFIDHKDSQNNRGLASLDLSNLQEMVLLCLDFLAALEHKAYAGVKLNSTRLKNVRKIVCHKNCTIN